MRARNGPAGRQHQSLGGAGHAGLAPIARQRVHRSHPDRRDRVVQHGDHLPDRILYQKMIEQLAALLTDGWIAMAQARPDRRHGLLAAVKQVPAGRTSARRAAKSVYHAFVAAVCQGQHGYHAIRTAPRPATE